MSDQGKRSCNNFNPIQNGPFWGYSRMEEEGQKGAPSLKSVTYILQ